MIPLFTVNMPQSVDKPLLEVLHSGYITQGPKVEEFERLLSEYFKTPALTVNSGTSALTLALRLAGVGPGDCVITTPMTCSATNLPILSLGAIPVWADIDPATGLIDPESVRDLTSRYANVKAVMAVDWGGTPTNVKELHAIAHVACAKLIIDAAHAFGAPQTFKSKADFVCFSFQAIKHISTVDGGAILIRDPKALARGKTLRWFGINRELGSLDSRINEDIQEWGYKFHMNDVAATIGIAQMDQVQVILATHQLAAHYYDGKISNWYGKPPVGQGAYWLYTLRLPNEKLRDEFKTYMAEQGIQVSQVHRRNDHYTAFKKYNERFYPDLGETKLVHELPGVDDFSARMVCIPVHSKLDREQVDTIIGACNAFAEAHQ